jgi:ankyrin repeat protein
MRRFAAQNPHLIGIPDAANLTPLSYAAEGGSDEKVNFLLTVGADATRAGRDGLTPMHIAARNRHAGIVSRFLDIGIDPLIKTAPIMRRCDRVDGYWVTYSEQEAEERRMRY